MSSTTTTELIHLLRLGILPMFSPESVNWKCMVKLSLKQKTLRNTSDHCSLQLYAYNCYNKMKS